LLFLIIDFRIVIIFEKRTEHAASFFRLFLDLLNFDNLYSQARDGLPSAVLVNDCMGAQDLKELVLISDFNGI